VNMPTVMARLRETRPDMVLKVLVILAAVLAPLIVHSPYTLRVLTLAVEYALVVMSYDIMIGHLGVLSLCQNLFWGLGGYVSALLVARAGFPWLSGFLLAGIAAVVMAVVVGIPALTLSYHSFAICTLAFSVSTFIVVRHLDFVGGDTGVFGVPRPEVFGFKLHTSVELYYLILAITLTSAVIIHMILRSRFGRTLAAIKGDEVLAKTIGISPKRLKLYGLMISAFFAGLAGSFHVHLNTIATPTLFDFQYITLFLIMVILGGKGSMWGVALGAVAFTFVPEILRIAQIWRDVIYGVVLLVTIVFLPGGLIQIPERIRALVRRRDATTVTRGQV